MLKIGLTGGIASGKSTVAKCFANLGVSIIDADVIAKSVTKPNAPAYKKIIKHFGNNFCLPDGTLNRELLKKTIFSNSQERTWLENLLHPVIYQEMQAQVKNCKGPYCVLVIPLLFETQKKEFRKIVDRILVVDVTKNIQIQRLKNRDRLTVKAARNILNTQTSRKTRLIAADDIIQNNTDLTALKSQILQLHKKYSKY